MDSQAGGQQPMKDLMSNSGCLISWLLLWMILPIYPVFAQNVNQPSNLVVTERQTAILNCSISTVFFKGTVSWFRVTQDGKEQVYPSKSNLRYKDRVHLDSEAFRTNGEATITILNVSQSDSGVYICQIQEVMAQNIQGNGTLLTVLCE
ncbi:natural cytotoxicity triggering receptor 3-like [Polypterus senegalus]|uniref:natural cytotoxicity triggering receptor 3-like n=1 Tax=Polypterus senegalus TaxID=55291 RepID=UPI001963F7C0|nr:natural cytotoxicity triggering receptor 3-like [Polypterus senegalus]